MFDISLSTEKKIFCLTIAAILLFAIGVKLFVVDKQMMHLAENIKTISEIKYKKSEIREFYQKHQDIKKYETELNTRQGLVNTMLPDALSVGSYLLELQHQAAEAGIVLLNIKPGKMKKEKQYCVQEVNISFKADYYQLNHFFRVLEQDGRFVQVSAMNLNSKVDGAILQGEVSLLIFAIRE